MKLEKASASEAKNRENDLFHAILQLKTAGECSAFFADLCTPVEIEAFRDRWAVARMLVNKKASYRDIHAKSRVSLATIVRVARFLNGENKGYELVLKRLGVWKNDK
ncbi:MAG: YerC/YecD family TrpR-related protein [Bdellovibrionales bacterium]